MFVLVSPSEGGAGGVRMRPVTSGKNEYSAQRRGSEAGLEIFEADSIIFVLFL